MSAPADGHKATVPERTRPVVRDQLPSSQDPHPVFSAPWYQRLTFTWMLPLLQRGVKEQLEVAHDINRHPSPTHIAPA